MSVDINHDAHRGAPDAAPASDPRVVHRYDDIEEYDSHLPNWWLYTLFGTIVFALGYYFYYSVLHVGPGSMAAFDQSMAADRRAAADRARSSGSMTDDALRTLARDSATVAEGRTVFMTTCVACHGPSGGGTIGPNLTDRAWLHGGAPTAIYHTVMEGVPAKGMPAWGAQLGAHRVEAAVAYVLTLRNTNAAGGKPAQGEVSSEE